MSAIWGFAVLRSGSTSAHDWDFCAIAIGIVALISARMLSADEDTPSLGPGLRWPLLLLPCYVAFQILPLPLPLVRLLSPARAQIADALAPVMKGASFAPLSVKVDATIEHLLRLLVYILVFFMIRRIGARLSANPWITALPIILVAVFEAVLGILQYTADPLRNVAQGTYLNRNHFAGLLEMSLPFALMFAASVLIRSGSSWMTEIRTAAKAGLGFAAAFTILLAIVRSLSRTSFVASMFSLLVMSVLLLRVDVQARTRRIVLLAGIALLLVTLLVFPPTRLVGRFVALRQNGGSERRMLLEQSTQLLGGYWLTGCGLGGYQYAWMKYKVGMPLWAADFVHNDYLQLLTELGVAGSAILAVLLIAMPVRVMQGTGPAVPAESRHVAIACAGAMAAILLHSLDDFNLYIPSNAMLLAWIGGIAAALPATIPPPRHGLVRARRMFGRAGRRGG